MFGCEPGFRRKLWVNRAVVERDFVTGDAPRSSVGDSLLGVENPKAEELVRPFDFYARRCEELRIAKDESATRYSKYTTGLTLIGLLACVVLFESVVGKRLPLWAPLIMLPPGALIGGGRRVY